MKKITWKQKILDNLSYKLVSLFIALILWLTILGRRDFVLSKTIETEVLVASGYSVTAQSVDRIRVKVSGPRTALRRFMDSGLSQQVSIDATAKTEGEFDLEIPLSKIDVPFGVKVLQVKPSSLRVVIKKSQ